MKKSFDAQLTTTLQNWLAESKRYQKTSRSRTIDDEILLSRDIEYDIRNMENDLLRLDTDHDIDIDIDDDIPQIDDEDSLFAKPEILQVIDSVARDKGIDREEVFGAMEQAIQKAGRSKYGHEHNICAQIDRHTGDIQLARYITVVEKVENEVTQITLDQARFLKPDAMLGESLVDLLPPIDFGRVAAQLVKQVIIRRVRDAEQQRQYSEYRHRVTEIVNGSVKRMEFDDIIVDIGRTEAILRRDELIPREHFKTGDRIRAYIYDVRQEIRGPQVFLSRTHPQFMARLFAQEVPEIYDGTIEIRAVARDPGSRAKMAVASNDSTIDPIGACVGMRGNRVQAVVQELQGEKIDITQWSSDPATFVVNALAPAEVSKVVLDRETKKIEAVVPNTHLSLAIGRRGQNVRLASQLTGWNIDIVTESEESERRQEEFRNRTKLFVEALYIDEVIASLLTAEGFGGVEEIAFSSLYDLLVIEAFDTTVASEIQQRAIDYINEQNRKFDLQRREMGVADSVAMLHNLTPFMLVALGKRGIKSLDDVADLATDELLEILGSSALTVEEAAHVIMEARAHWFN